MKDLGRHIYIFPNIGVIVPAVLLKAVFHLSWNIASDIKRVSINTAIGEGKTIPVRLIGIIHNTDIFDITDQFSSGYTKSECSALGIFRKTALLSGA